MRRAELLSQESLPQYRRSERVLSGQSSRSVWGATVGACLAFVGIIALLVVRVARTQGLNPASLRATHRRSSSRRQARHL